MDPTSFLLLEYDRVIQEYKDLYFVLLRTLPKKELLLTSEIVENKKDGDKTKNQRLVLEVITLENQRYFLEIHENHWLLLNNINESLKSFDSFEIFANAYSPMFKQRFQQKLYEALCDFQKK